MAVQEWPVRCSLDPHPPLVCWGSCRGKFEWRKESQKATIPDITSPLRSLATGLPDPHVADGQAPPCAESPAM